MAKDIQTIKNQFQIIQNETVEDANTAIRVGGAGYDLADYVEKIGDETIFPDEEDVTIDYNQRIKLKNRPNSDTQKGYIILRRNQQSGRDLLDESLLSEKDTRYFLRYGFEAQNNITIPDGVELIGDGGSIYAKNIILGDNCIVSNIRIRLKEGCGIELGNNCTIDNCIIEYDTYGALNKGSINGKGVSNVFIQRNKIGEQIWQDVGMAFHIRLDDCKDYIVSDNNLKTTEGEGIMVVRGNGVITNNVTHGCWSGIGTGDDGDNDTYTSTLISNNVINNSIAAGITINSKNVLCLGNQINFVNHTANGPGIRYGHAPSPANNCIVSNNILNRVNSDDTGASSSDRGISCDFGNNSLVIGNKIKGFPKGIVTSNAPKNIRILNNDIYGFINGIEVFQGTYVFDTLVEVSGNHIEGDYDENLHTGNSQVGVKMMYTNIICNDNYVRNCQQLLSTFISNRMYVQMRNNNLEGNIPIAFSGNSTRNIEFIGNQILFHNKSTLSFPFEDGTISNNTITNATVYPSWNVVMKNNIIDTKSADTAIYIARSKKTIIKNNILKLTNGEHAIWYNSADASVIESVDITNNTILGANQYIGGAIKLQATGKIVAGYLWSKSFGAVYINNNGNLVDEWGFSYTRKKGTTGERPTSFLVLSDSGYMYFDTMLGEYILWNGTDWVGIDGLNYNRQGTTANRPTSYLVAGFTYYDTTIKKLIAWNGSSWIDSNGFTPALEAGDSASRPSLNSTTDKGFVYFDTSLNKPIWWVGTKWVDATGIDV